MSILLPYGITIAAGVSPALLSVALVVNPHAAADIGTAARLLERYPVPAVAAGILADKAADRADKVAGMVVVVGHT